MSTLPDKQAEILHKLDIDGLLSTALMVVGTHAFSTYKWPTNAIFPAGHEETQGFASTWCRDTPASLTLTGPDVDNTKRKTFFSVLRGFGPSYKINPCKPFQAMNAYGYEVELLAAPSFHPLPKDNLRRMVHPAPVHSRLMTLPIGVFDSGIGGLSVLKALRAALPHQDFIYLADNGHAPYGERDTAHVLARSRAAAQYLVGQNVKALVVACNTATAAAIDLLRTEHPKLPIIGVEPALKPAATLSKTGRIGVMATRSTLTSARFQTLLAAQAGAAEFVLQPCDGLADAIERGASIEDATEIIAACAHHTGAMGLFGIQPGHIDTLVLGCTHYPFVSEHLQALVGADVRLIENGEAVARQTQRLLYAAAGNIGQAVAGPGRIRLIATGDTYTLKAAAAHWLALHEPVDLLQI